MPPAGVAEALPVLWPKHRTLDEDAETDNKEGWPTVAIAVALQELTSFTVKVYEPALRFMAEDEVCNGTVLHEYE